MTLTIPNDTPNKARAMFEALRDRGHRVALDTPTNNVIVANDEPLRLVRESAKGRKKLVVELTDKTHQGVLFIGADDAPGQEYLFG